MPIKNVNPVEALRILQYPLMYDPKLRTMLPSQFQATQRSGWEYMGPEVGFENPDAMRPEGGRWPTFGVVEGPGAPGSIPGLGALRGLNRTKAEYKG